MNVSRMRTDAVDTNNGRADVASIHKRLSDQHMFTLTLYTYSSEVVQCDHANKHKYLIFMKGCGHTDPNKSMTGIPAGLRAKSKYTTSIIDKKLK